MTTWKILPEEQSSYHLRPPATAVLEVYDQSEESKENRCDKKTIRRGRKTSILILWLGIMSMVFVTKSLPHSRKLRIYLSSLTERNSRSRWLVHAFSTRRQFIHEQRLSLMSIQSRYLANGVFIENRFLYPNWKPSSGKKFQSFPVSSTSRLHSTFTKNNDNSDDGDQNTEREHVSQSLTPNPGNGLSSLAISIQDRVLDLIQHHVSLSSSTCVHEKSFESLVVPIVVSVSGGCDSVALFHALMEWNESLQKQQPSFDDSRYIFLTLDITVVHFHHRQRPIDADKDYRFVKTLVENATKAIAVNEYESNVAFVLEDWDFHTQSISCTKGDEKYSPSSFSQDKARTWRRLKLKDCALERLHELRGKHSIVASKYDAIDGNTKVPLGIVLMAHHEDDSYETVLIKLLRGVHLLNLDNKATIKSIVRLSDESNASARNSDASPIKQTESDGDIFLLRPFVSWDGQFTLNDDSIIMNSLSLPGHSKADLVKYLEERNLTWREDASNHDPNSKYLRNRVRNELIPLLKELSEDSFRTKRIPALLEQSNDLKQDVTPRVKNYLSSALIRMDNEECFFRIQEETINNERADVSKLILSQALYEWITLSINEKIRYRFTFDAAQDLNSDAITPSYESLQRVVRQLQNHPERTQWKVEIGSNWVVERAGDILRVKDTMFKGGNGIKNDRGHKIIRIEWDWMIMIDEEIAKTSIKSCSDNVFLRIPRNFISNKNDELSFVWTTLSDASYFTHDRAPRFIPPWKTSPLKLKAFLRGQKIPLHARDKTPLLFVNRTSEKNTETKENLSWELAAVCVDKKWIVSRAFSIDSSGIGNGRREHVDGESETLIVKVFSAIHDRE